MEKKEYEIIAVTKIILVYPYSESIIELIELVNNWNMRLRQCDTHKPWAIIEIPSKKFKDIFHINPKPATYNVPSGAEKFIKGVEVQEIIIREINDDKNARDKPNKTRKRKRNR